MFNIFADWPKNKKIVPAYISYTHYRTLEMSTLYHYHVQIAKFSTRKTHFKPKLQKMYLQIIVTLR